MGHKTPCPPSINPSVPNEETPRGGGGGRCRPPPPPPSVRPPSPASCRSLHLPYIPSGGFPWAGPVSREGSWRAASLTFMFTPHHDPGPASAAEGGTHTHTATHAPDQNQGRGGGSVPPTLPPPRPPNRILQLVSRPLSRTATVFGNSVWKVDQGYYHPHPHPSHPHPSKSFSGLDPKPKVSERPDAASVVPRLHATAAT